jgi:hypothetical protein
MLREPQRLLATEGGVIRYRLRMRERDDLLFMLLTNRPDGGFGGNFEYRISAGKLQPGPDGWCDLEIPLDRYRPVDKRPHLRERHPTAAGNIITAAIVNSFDRNQGLEVVRFELAGKK